MSNTKQCLILFKKRVLAGVICPWLETLHTTLLQCPIQPKRDEFAVFMAIGQTFAEHDCGDILLQCSEIETLYKRNFDTKSEVMIAYTQTLGRENKPTKEIIQDYIEYVDAFSC